MNRDGLIVVLLFIPAVPIFAAGCVSFPVAENATAITSPTVRATSPIIMSTPAPTVITTVPTECPVPVNGSYWIKINPISNVSMGDPIFVNGTTNIPAGMTLNVDIVRYQFRAVPHYEPPHISGIVEIMKNEGCPNLFSFYSNTTGLGDPGQIEVSVYSLDFNLSGYHHPANLSEPPELPRPLPFSRIPAKISP